MKGTESYSYIFQMRKLKPRREINLTKVKASYPVLKPKSLSSGASKFLAAAAAKSLQSCPTLCDPRDGSPAGSPIPGILQARTLEWVAISFSNA